MFVFFFVIVALVLLTYFVLRLPVFGSLPQGAALQKIKNLPNYLEGELKNESYTPVKPDDVTYMMMITALLKKNPFKRPLKTLPHVTPELHSTIGTTVTWFGHSSYLIQTEKLKVMVDPVFSPSTSPFTFIGNKSYPGTDFIQAEDFPALDIIVITHDHYDHLDYQSILKLKATTGHFVTSLGVASHLLRWGIPAEKITELAWGEEATVKGLRFVACAGRHFSGRAFKRNQSLWSSFVLEAPGAKLFLGGDSGYDSHFKRIGAEFGPFDLALLECGQYNNYWRDIHMFPEQTVQAAIDLQAKVLMPVHWGKFSLALHNWDEPVKRAVLSAAEKNQQITTPMLGESVVLNEKYPDQQWWLNFSEG